MLLKPMTDFRQITSGAMLDRFRIKGMYPVKRVKLIVIRATADVKGTQVFFFKQYMRITS